MASSNVFKSYERGTRYHTTETTFSSGMQYTSEPLNEGAVKTLVNYTVANNGAALSPRKGLRVSAIGAYEQAKYDSSDVIVACKECYKNDKVYGQFITASSDYKYLNVITTYNSEKTENELCGIPTIKQQRVSQVYQDNTLFDKCVGKFISNNNLNIHNLEYASDAIKTHIGTFIDDQYYFFDINKKRIVYTYFNEATDRYEFKMLEPEEVDLNTAKQLGFNMLLDKPYAYVDKIIEGGAASISFLGMAAYEDEACTKPAKELIENTTYYYRINYNATNAVTATDIKVKFEWLIPDNTMLWQTIQDLTAFNINTTDPAPLKVAFASPVEKAIIACTAYRIPEGGSEYTEVIDKIWLSFDYKTTSTQTVKNTNINYSLYTASVITTWQRRLVVAGVEEDASYIFMSLPERFEYFPFPAQADYLNEPIIAAAPFLDDLLVFTKSCLYQYTIAADGSTFSRKCIQNHLNIDSNEAHLIQVVKNMVYFKSGNYYYMVVPKLNSLTGELTIAPVSKNIIPLFDNFKASVQDILQSVYDIRELPDLYAVYDFLDFENVYNVYTFKIKKGLYINFCLLYNTVKRMWSIQCIESSNILRAYKQDITKSGTLVCMSFIANNTAAQNGVLTKMQPVIQFLDWSENRQDMYLPLYIFDDSTTQTDLKFKNWQFIDTGNRNIYPEYKKRYREIQFKINNTHNDELAFSTGFYVDGETRKDYYEYVPIVNKATNEVVIDRILCNTQEIPNTTKLGQWKLSTSTFPGTDNIKIRMPVSGKGYVPCIKILCQSQKPYTLLNICNVYRVLYLR